MTYRIHLDKFPRKEKNKRKIKFERNRVVIPGLFDGRGGGKKNRSAKFGKKCLSWNSLMLDFSTSINPSCLQSLTNKKNPIIYQLGILWNYVGKCLSCCTGGWLLTCKIFLMVVFYVLLPQRYKFFFPVLLKTSLPWGLIKRGTKNEEIVW